jgi:hypothetical protein
MIYSQVFKTVKGINKRLAFERATRPEYAFYAVFCHTDGAPFGYSWIDKPRDLAYDDVRFRIQRVKIG